MKSPIRLLYLALLAICFTSCSDDTSEEFSNDSPNQGEWKLTKTIIETPIDLNNDGVLSNVLFEAPGYSDDSYIIFNDSTQGTIFFTEDINYFTSNENEALVFMTISSTSSDRVPQSMTYSLMANQGVMYCEDMEFGISINANEMRVTIENGFIARDINTLETTVSQDLTYIYTKNSN